MKTRMTQIVNAMIPRACREFCASSLSDYVTRRVTTSHLFSLETLDNHLKWGTFVLYDKISFDEVRSYLLFETSPNILFFQSDAFQSGESTMYNRSGLNERVVHLLFS